MGRHGSRSPDSSIASVVACTAAEAGHCHSGSSQCGSVPRTDDATCPSVVPTNLRVFVHTQILQLEKLGNPNLSGQLFHELSGGQGHSHGSRVVCPARRRPDLVRHMMNASLLDETAAVRALSYAF